MSEKNRGIADQELVTEAWWELDGPWQPSGLGPVGWIEDTGNVGTALTYSTVLWPQFVQYRERVFLDRSFTIETADQWFAKFPDEPHRVQSVMNHVHIADIFENDQRSAPELLEAFCYKLRECWTAKLAVEFPDKCVHVVVETPSDTETDEPEGFVVTFYEQ